MIFGPINRLPGSRKPHEFAAVYSRGAVPVDHTVPFDNRVETIDVHVAERLENLFTNFLLAGAARRRLETRDVQDAVLGPGLIHHIEARLILELLKENPDH